MEKFISKNDLKELVYILGKYPFNTMPAFYNYADAMFLSLKADFPHLKAVVPARLQSYLSAAKPVLAMIDGGAADVIRESNCGYAVPAASYKELVTVIKKVLKERESFKKMGINGRKYFEANFTKEKCIQDLINIIKTNNF